uniref:Uncharacterized protein n=1 Tax=Morchella brunnea TaxID=1174671 RepID=A0A8K1I807_9PEZI|nr:hypothetical protein LK370_mgp153 [Morchella brunnea]UBU98440.1 hypothetical protein [Morchella brunnea]
MCRPTFLLAVAVLDRVRRWCSISASLSLSLPFTWISTGRFFFSRSGGGATRAPLQSPPAGGSALPNQIFFSCRRLKRSRTRSRSWASVSERSPFSLRPGDHCWGVCYSSAMTLILCKQRSEHPGVGIHHIRKNRAS